jgi:hypothetical protein
MDTPHPKRYLIVPRSTLEEPLPSVNLRARDCASGRHLRPNRAFACAATSQGHMDDKDQVLRCPEHFRIALSAQSRLGNYAYGNEPLTRLDFRANLTSPFTRMPSRVRTMPASAARGMIG